MVGCIKPIVACLVAVQPLVALGAPKAGNQDVNREEALEALKKSASFFRHQVASHGGYVYYYSPDLKERWGEGKWSADTIFVQPPGTPTVGMAYLKAYEATADPFYLAAAREAAAALVAGQLQSGGWTQAIHFARPQCGRWGNYRKRAGGNWNYSSLDDGQTQAALTFLIRTDRALGFQHAEIHDAALYGLKALLQAQFPNGAFPQVWQGPVERQPVMKARFPDYDWKTEGRVKNYWDFYTLNDNLAGDVAKTLITAHQIYEDARYEHALKKLADFLVLAQMPDPQPGWCQQYNYQMFPIWARKFEPPAITGWESQDVMETLIRVAHHTGDKKYLEPIPRALAYFEECLLPDGKIARYYELETNRLLYMDSEYQLTFDDSDLPPHYAWKQPARLEGIKKAYHAVRAGNDPARSRSSPAPPEKVRRIIRSLDDHGRWISVYSGERLTGQPGFDPGYRYVSSLVFSRNVEILSDFLTTASR